MPSFSVKRDTPPHVVFGETGYPPHVVFGETGYPIQVVKEQVVKNK